MDVSHFSQLPISADSERPRDRLSELPDSLLHEILSPLEMKDVVRTTILSQRWKDLWTTVPCLHFDDANRSFIRRALANWKGAKIQKFKIMFWKKRPPPKKIVDSWLLLPIDKQVEDLCFSSGPRVDPLDYSAPQRLYSCSSLTKLFISCCDLDIAMNVQWNQLRSLTIDGIYYLSEEAMNKIIAGAPVLEELVLNLFEIVENLNIRSTSLKVLRVGKHDNRCCGDVGEAVIGIWAPNLLIFEISAFFFGGNCLLDVPSLKNAILQFQTREDELFDLIEMIPRNQFSPLEMFNGVFQSICHVEKVTLSALCAESLVSLKKKGMVVPFLNATFLKLHTYKAEEMLHVLEMFPNLMMLMVERSDKDLDASFISSAPDVTLSSPSLLQLKNVTIAWSLTDASMIPAIEILLKNAHMLEEMVLQLRIYGANQEAFALAKKIVLSMPRSSPSAKVVIKQRKSTNERR